MTLYVDLDSIISSLLFAYLSSQCCADDKLYIPLIKVPKADLALRPELKYVLDQINLDDKKLVCIDDLDIREPTDIVLVDHNHLTKPFDTSEWADHVVGVLDHHVDEKLYLDIPLRVVEMVGSCVTLVLDHFKQHKHIWLNDTIACLAMAPLLVDTVNLKWELGRTTEKDAELFNLLKQQQPMTLTTDDYFKKIEKVKSQVDTMSNYDILRRDYKEFHMNGFVIGTSAVTWNFRAWAAREKEGSQAIIDTVHTFIKDRHLDMEFIVTAFDYDSDHTRSPDGDYRRELALFIHNPILRVVKEQAEKDETVQLNPNLQMNPTRDPNLEFYDQGNVKMSRKQVWPLLKALIEPLSLDNKSNQ